MGSRERCIWEEDSTEITGKSSSLGRSACIMDKRCPVTRTKNSICSLALSVNGYKCQLALAGWISCSCTRDFGIKSYSHIKLGPWLVVAVTHTHITRQFAFYETTGYGVTKITQNHQASYMRSNFSPHLLRDNRQVQKSHLQIHLHHQLLNNLLHHHLFHNQIGFPQVPPVQWKWHLDVTDEIV